MFFDKDKYADADEEKLEELIGKACKQGAVYALMHFDAHGSEETAVRDSLVDFIARLTKEKGVVYCKGEIETAMEKDGMYSSFAEVTVLGEHFNALLNLCLKYGPVAVEILKPKELRLTVEEAQSLLLDAAQATQEYSQYILEKTLSADDLRTLQQRVKRRTELGERFRKKAEEFKEEPKD